MNNNHYLIGELAKKAGCKVETVHYYEKIGLMPEPPRSNGGHRIYNIIHMKRLNYIRRSRELGFSIEQIRSLLKFIDEPDHSCGEIKSIALLQAHEIKQKINDLEKLNEALNKMISSCKGNNMSIDNCPIFDALYKN